MKIRNIKRYCEIFEKHFNNKNYKKALKEHNKFPTCLLSSNRFLYKGVCYARLNLLKQAIKTFNQAIIIDNKNVDAYYNRGLAYNNLGISSDNLNLYKQAIQDFTKVIYFDPNYDRAYGNRGNCYIDLKEFTKAIEDLTKAIELNPNYIEAYGNRSAAYIKLKEPDKAINDCNKLISLGEKSGYHNRAIANELLERYDNAIFDFSKAIEFDTKNYHAYWFRGNVFSKIKQYEKAIKDYTKAIELAQPKDVGTIYRIRGNAYIELGEIAKANADFDNVEKIITRNLN